MLPCCSLLLSCGFDSTGTSGGSPVTLADMSDTGGSTDEDGSSDRDDADAPGSVSNTGESTTSQSTGDSTSDPSSTTGLDSATEDSGETTTAEPKTAHLQNANQTSCTGPLWCVYDGNIENPTGSETWVQECFTSPLSPPYELVELHWIVAASAATLAAFDLQVREATASGPGSVIATVSVDASMGVPGEHVITLPQPVEITNTRFCVGFHFDGAGLTNAIGIAVDSDSSLSGPSWLRSPDCSVSSWTDVVVAGYSSGGNWCIDATVREIL